jgi:hypothetical protein
LIVTAMPMNSNRLLKRMLPASIPTIRIYQARPRTSVPPISKGHKSDHPTLVGLWETRRLIEIPSLAIRRNNSHNWRSVKTFPVILTWRNPGIFWDVNLRIRERKWRVRGMIEAVWLRRPTRDSSSLGWMRFLSMTRRRSFVHVSYLLAGRWTLSVRQLINHPNTVWTSAGTPSAASLSGESRARRGTGSSVPGRVGSKRDVDCKGDDMLGLFEVDDGVGENMN